MVTPRSRPLLWGWLGKRAPQILEIPDSGVHARDVLEHQRSGLDLARRFIRDEILAKRRQTPEQLEPAIEKSHVRREHLVTGAHEVITVEGLHVDRTVRAEVHTIEEYLRARAVSTIRGSANVHDRSESVGRDGAGNETRARRQQWGQVLGVQVAVIPHAPPAECRALLFQREP